VLRSYTNIDVIIEWHTRHSGGSRKLKLNIVPRLTRGEREKSLQSRLEGYIRLFNTYREIAPVPGREKSVLDVQFELDIEIKTIHWEMKYLGYTPNLGDYIL